MIEEVVHFKCENMVVRNPQGVLQRSDWILSQDPNRYEVRLMIQRHTVDPGRQIIRDYCKYIVLTMVEVKRNL